MTVPLNRSVALGALKLTVPQPVDLRVICALSALLRLIIRPVFLCMLLLVAATFSHPAKATQSFLAPMSFHLDTSGGNCATCLWVSAEGVIQPNTHEHFLNFLSQKKMLGDRGINVHLSSPGGDLLGGILLGLAIHSIGANTVVGSGVVEEVYEGGLRKVSSKKSNEIECSSACAFAFLGGITRFASKTTPPYEIGFQQVGKLGVHQFYDSVSLDKPNLKTLTASDRVADQRLVAAMLEFLSLVDVSAEVLQLASSTSPHMMHYLSEEELLRTRADNHMLKNAFVQGYKNGVAAIEVNFRRQEADYRIELYCKSDQLHMLATIEWRNFFSETDRKRWKLYEGLSLLGGGRVRLVSVDLMSQNTNKNTTRLNFSFSDKLGSLIGRKEFFFEDWSSRHANDAAARLGFTLPSNFDGLYLLPKTCLP